MVKRRIFLKYATTGVICGVIAGVGGWLAGSAAAPVKTITITETVTPKPPRVIKIGGTVPLTGFMAPICSPLGRMYDEWVKMVNERGGLYVKEYGMRLPVKFIWYDDKSDIDTIVKYYEKLCTVDKVDVLVSPICDGHSLAAAPIACKYGIPYIEGAANPAKPYIEGWKWCTCQSAMMEEWLYYFFQYLAEEGKVKTLACIRHDTPYAHDVHIGVKAFHKNFGIDLIFDEKVPFGCKDFSALIAKLKILDPDQILFITNAQIEDVAFWKQVYELGYRPPAFHSNCGGALKAFQDPTGPLGDYVTGDVWYDESFPYDGYWGHDFYIELQERAKFRDWDYPWLAVFFQSLEQLAAAIEWAGSLDKEAINNSLHNLGMMNSAGPTITRGPGSVLLTGRKIKGWVGSYRAKPVQMIEKRRYIFWPPELATVKVKPPRRIYPIPWEKIEEKVGRK